MARTFDYAKFLYVASKTQKARRLPMPTPLMLSQVLVKLAQATPVERKKLVRQARSNPLFNSVWKKTI